MKISHTISDTRDAIIQAKQAGKVIAFVPTMGNLHEGHLKLYQAACKKADYIVASIFVNPIQFNSNQDYDSYPRTLGEDCNKLAREKVDLVFAPNTEEIYPKGLNQHTRIFVPGISELHCGAHRPGHFKGVATVVTKLFNIVTPNIAFFGEKDYQQLAVIRQMVNDLSLPITIDSIPTVREADGLAMSSRNHLLTPAQRTQALSIYSVLTQMKNSIINGMRDFKQIEVSGISAMRESGLKPEYLSVCRRSDLHYAASHDKELIILAASFAGSTRLIDNIMFDLK